MIEPLNTRAIHACYDERLRLMLIVYRHKLDAHTTLQAYDWRARVLSAYGVAGVRGCIDDFRAITEISANNYLTLQDQSSRLNERFDLTHHVVALVARADQDEFLHHANDMTARSHSQRRIVRDYAAAVQLLNEYAQAHGLQHGISGPALQELPCGASE
jgi:hypothetical protein